MLPRYLSRLAVACGLALAMAAAGAHPSPQSEVLMQSRPGGIAAELVLPLEELKLAFDRPLPVSDADIAAYLAPTVAHGWSRSSACAGCPAGNQRS
jgi:hypothetical protein